MVGLIAAMDEEIECVLQKMNVSRREIVSGVTFYVGDFLGRELVAARCGIGKVFASLCAECMELVYGAKYIVNIGVAGALKDGLRAGDVVISSGAVQHDFDTGDGTPGKILGLDLTLFPCSEISTDLADLSRNLGFNVTYGVCATGDRFISDSAEKNRVKSQFSAAICDMETCAIAQVSLLNGAKFLGIRAISDSADESADESFVVNLKNSAKNAYIVFENLLNNGEFDC